MSALTLILKGSKLGYSKVTISLYRKDNIYNIIFLETIRLIQHVLLSIEGENNREFISNLMLMLLAISAVALASRNF